MSTGLGRYTIVFVDKNRYEIRRATRPFLSYGAALSWAYNNLDTYDATGARVEIGW